MSGKYGRGILHKGDLRPDTPAGGVAASAVTVTGAVSPAGAPVEIAWGASALNAPVSGWLAAPNGTGLGATFSLATTRPAAGTWYLWARLRNWPRTTGVSQSVVVT